jgi:hypothetical protein
MSPLGLPESDLLEAAALATPLQLRVWRDGGTIKLAPVGNSSEILKRFSSCGETVAYLKSVQPR